jgi:hypothetical protein
MISATTTEGHNMDTKIKRATKAECLKVFKAVCKQYGVTQEDIDKGYGPQLMMDWDWLGFGPNPAILWEGGPYDWTHYTPYGGRCEEGWTIRDVSSQMPPGVRTEPMTGWALSIYKD